MTALSETKRYQAYPEYKDSGVEWVGNIPSHWQVTPIKYLATLNPRKSAIDSSLLNKECNFLPMEKLKLNSIVLDEKRLVSDVYDGYTYFEDGDVLMAKVTPCFENKNIAVASGLLNGVGFGSSEIYVLRSNEKTDNRFLYYRLQEDSFMDIATAAMTGAGGLKRVPSEVVNGYSLGTPEVEEQTQIANFLDHETAKIDTLIEKQQQLIKLLKEKRQAVISHAVTKGLNPQAPMKNSGVEWLGEVPEHWGVSSLGYYASLNTGATPDRSNSSYWEGDIPWIKTGEVKYETIYKTEESISKLAVKQTSVQLSPPGTLLMAMYGQGVTRGRVAILGVHATYNQACVAITPNSYLFNEYLKVFFIAGYHAIRDGGNETSQMNLNADIVRKFKVTVPPIDEQKEIVSFLEAELPRFDALLENADKAIKLMQERRTALISAAVTGKIDVREWRAH
ncbi:restriction endonuclease subunit S [Vibrio fluvialis]|nr:restriction endonuclease subunit S [Vibrio fluvialis]ELL9328857.1 restriction endonuclease subunit S [Vibrio fluvialis]